METLIRVAYKPYKKNELAKILNCSLSILEKLVSSLLDLIGPIINYLFSIRQVRTILNALGKHYILVSA